MNRLALILFIIISNVAVAQTDTVSIYTLFRDTTGGRGEVRIQQDPTLRLLIDRDIQISERQRGIKDGYRIQIFSKYGSDSRDKSQDVRILFLTEFPDFDPLRVYSSYEPPFIKVRVGDYRNKSEALEDHRIIVKEFPDSYIVKTRINYPQL
ncbi:MAG: hypothetical protein PF489_05855 [Salinivirgaceae bacterium]|jgi:hypothetical protein|nr:hypothetical protein [Salinivirgaceae bacterium]